MFKSDIKEYDTRHGGAFDRGSADSYYGRPRRPHFYLGGTGNSPEIAQEVMSDEDIAAYHAGYDHNEQYGDKKSCD
jgi:hypothetical protein